VSRDEGYKDGYQAAIVDVVAVLESSIHGTDCSDHNPHQPTAKPIPRNRCTWCVLRERFEALGKDEAVL